MRLKENRCTTTHLEVFYAGTLGGDLSHRKLEYVACSERTGGAKWPRRQGVEPWKESLSIFFELFDNQSYFVGWIISALTANFSTTMSTT